MENIHCVIAFIFTVYCSAHPYILFKQVFSINNIVVMHHFNMSCNFGKDIPQMCLISSPKNIVISYQKDIIAQCSIHPKL